MKNIIPHWKHRLNQLQSDVKNLKIFFQKLIFFRKSQSLFVDLNQNLNPRDDLSHEGSVSEFGVEHEDDQVAKSGREGRVSGKANVLGAALNGECDAVSALVNGVVGRVVEAERVEKTA